MENFITDNCEIIQYADDTILFVSNKNPNTAASILEANIQSISTYLQSHKLTMNTDKTKFLISCKKTQNDLTQNIVMSVNNDIIKQVTEAKYLGVIIDKNLCFEREVKRVLQKMAIGIKTIYKIRDYLPQVTRILLLQSLVLSHFQYSSILLTGISQELLNSLEKQLNWGLKACFFKSMRDSATALKLSSKILPIKNQISIRCAQTLWKLIHNKSEPFQSLLFPNFDLQQNQRTKIYTVQKRPRTKYLQNSFMHSAVIFWNTIPLQIQNQSSFRVFKKRLKRHEYQVFANMPHDRVISNAWINTRID